MLRVSSSSLRVICWHLSFAILILLSSTGQSQAVVRKTIGGAVTQTPDPIPACLTSGYSIDAVLDFTIIPGAQSQLDISVVERSRRPDRIGYFITRNTLNGEIWAFIYDAVSMQLLRSVMLEPPGTTIFSNQSVGTVFNNTLYMARNVAGGQIGCPPARACMAYSSVSPSGTYTRGNAVILTPATDNVANLSDLLIMGDGTAHLLFARNAGGAMAIFDSASLFPFFEGAAVPNLGNTAVFADQPIGINSIFVTNTFVNPPAAFVFPSGSSSPTGSSAWATNFGQFGNAITYADSLVIGEAYLNGSARGDVWYKTAGLSNALPTVQYPVSPFFASQVRAGLYYDRPNNRLHSIRTDISPGSMFIARTTVDPFTVEQIFGLGFDATTRFRSYDYVESTERLYFSTNPVAGLGRVTRVKVCSTGGPPA